MAPHTVEPSATGQVPAGASSSADCVVAQLMGGYDESDIISSCVRCKWCLPPVLAVKHQADIARYVDIVMQRSKSATTTRKKRCRAQADQAPNPNTTSRYLTAANVWVGFVYHKGLQASLLHPAAWAAPAESAMCSADGSFLYELYKYVATDRYGGCGFEAEIDSCMVIVNCVLSLVVTVAGWQASTHYALEKVAAIARQRLLKEAPRLNVIRDTKGALNWEFVDLMLRAFDRWSAVGHVHRTSRFWPMLGKAVLCCLEYSGLRPFCFFKVGTDCRDERFRENCCFKLGQVRLYWGDTPGQLVIHGEVYRTKNERDPPKVQQLPGVTPSGIARKWFVMCGCRTMMNMWTVLLAMPC